LNGCSAIGVAAVDSELSYSVTVENVLDVWDHGDLDFAGDGKVEGHAEVVVNFASIDFHFTEAVVKESLSYLLFNQSAILVTTCALTWLTFQIVNVLNDGQPFPFNDLVGDARIVRIDFETN
jgi:hypothetical protein